MRTSPLVAVVGAAGLVSVLAACGSSGTASETSASISKPSPTPSRSVTANPVVTAQAALSQADGKTTATVDGVTVTTGADGVPVISIAPGTAVPDSVVVADITPGTGATIPAGGAGEFDYEGVLLSDGTVFDSSFMRGQPVSFSLNQVIPGWQTGIPGMQEGGTRLIIIPPNQAYGARAMGGIPPNSALVFVVQLDKVLSQ